MYSRWSCIVIKCNANVLLKTFIMLRRFTTKTSIQSIAALRKHSEGCSIQKAKEALQLSGNNQEKALEWLRRDANICAEKKAKKLSTRLVTEGLIGVSIDAFGLHCSMVELNCESDFVSRGSLFTDMVMRSTERALLLDVGTDIFCRMSVNVVMESSITLGTSVEPLIESCTSLIGKVGENIKLTRALRSGRGSSFVYGAYAHSAGQTIPAGLGRVGAVIALDVSSSENKKKIAEFANRLAQHVAGFSPISIIQEEGMESGDVLLNQPFLFGGGTVKEVLESTRHLLGCERLRVIDFKRWECGKYTD